MDLSPWNASRRSFALVTAGMPAAAALVGVRTDAKVSRVNHLRASAAAARVEASAEPQFSITTTPKIWTLGSSTSSCMSDVIVGFRASCGGGGGPHDSRPARGMDTLQ